MGDLYIEHEERCDKCMMRLELIDMLEETNKMETEKKVKGEINKNHLNCNWSGFSPKVIGEIGWDKLIQARIEIIKFLQYKNMECADNAMQGGPEPNDI